MKVACIKMHYLIIGRTVFDEITKCACILYLLASSHDDVRHLLQDIRPFTLEADVNGILWTSRGPTLLHHGAHDQLKDVVSTWEPHQWFSHCPFDEYAGT